MSSSGSPSKLLSVPFVMLDITTSVRVEDSRHNLGETAVLAFLYIPHAAREALVRWLFCNSPVVCLGSSHTNS